MPRGCIVDGEVADPDAVAEVVRRVFDRNGIGTRRVATAVSGNAVIVKRITLPLMDEDDLAESIRWEAEQHVPFDTRDVNLDYQVLRGGRRRGEPHVDGSAPGGRQEGERSPRTRTWSPRRAGRRRWSTVAAFALQNAFEVNHGIDPVRVTMLVNAGASGMNVNVVAGGQSLFTRDVAVGGDAYTEGLRSELDLSFDDADRLKQGQAVDGAGPEDAGPIVRAVSEDLSLEIEKTFDFFRAATGAERIDELVVGGGSAAVEGFLEALEGRFAVPVSPLDPFRRIDRGPGAAGADGYGEPDPAAAVAVGLALRHGEVR